MFPALCVSQNRTFDRAMIFQYKEGIGAEIHSGANKVVDSRRSLGLGLSLCKSIVTAHGGTISVSDNQPNGTVFTFTLPAGEVELHE